MEFGDIGSMASTSKWFKNAISLDLPVEAKVISRQGADWILFVEGNTDKKAYFRLTSESENVGDEKREIKLRDTIKVREAAQIILDQEMAPEISPSRRVISYEIIGKEQEPSYCEIVAVAEVAERHIVVVGTSFSSTEPGVYFCRPQEQNYKVGQFLMASCYPAEAGVRCFQKEKAETKEKYYSYTEMFGNNTEDSESIHFPGEVRPLLEEEMIWIKTRLRTKEEITSDEALLYIRDPHIAARTLEKYQEYWAAKEVTLELLAHQVFVQGEACILQFVLSTEQYNQCVETESRYQWRNSSELSVSHEELKSGHHMAPAFVCFNSSKVKDDGKVLIELKSEERSKHLMRLVLDHHVEFAGKIWRIGPHCEMSDTVTAAIKEGFEEFFTRTEAFNQFSGRIPASEDIEIPDKDEPFLVKGKRLDPYQLEFMKTAAHHPGWTCAQAPPGCGKTHTTSALIAYLHQKKVKGGVCISGTTNAAVTNAADAVKENFPHIQIVRNYSGKAQFGITEKSEEISLKKMAKDCYKHLDENEGKRVFRARTKHLRSVRKYKNTNFEKINIQAKAYDKMNKTEKILKNSFISHYQMNVYATTVELLITGGDKFVSGVVRDSTDYSEKAIRRLILDEAAQLSASEALALYCRLPELTHITLLGDSYQLGPHSRIERGTDVHNFKTEGELTRMFNLPSTIKKSLNGLYRCHPLISEKVLLPIYGDMMEPRMTAEQRNLAAVKGLPMAKDGSPIVMFNVQGEKDRCSNEAEARAVVNFVIDMVIPPPQENGETRQGVEEKDIVILVFHRRQKITLEKMFNSDQQLTRKSGIRIETVDSFQGKEAKIVILCTTKSGAIGNVENKLQFIADPQRATVALSRAQHALYVFGDLQLLAHSKFYAKIMKLLIGCNGLMDAKVEPLNSFLKEKIRKTLNKTLGISAKDEIKARMEIRKARMAKKEEEKQETAVIEEENRENRAGTLLVDENVVKEVSEETKRDALQEKLDNLTIESPKETQVLLEMSQKTGNLVEEKKSIAPLSRRRSRGSKQKPSFAGSAVAPVIQAGTGLPPPPIPSPISIIKGLPSDNSESIVKEKDLIEL